MYKSAWDRFSDSFWGGLFLVVGLPTLAAICIVLSCLTPQWYLEYKNSFTDSEAEQALELIMDEDITVISMTHEWLYTNDSTILFRTQDGIVHEAQCFADTKNEVTCQITNWIKFVE